MGLENCQTILVPVDFSADSLAAVEAALVLAQKLGSGVIMVHVVHDPSNRPGFYHSRRAGLTVIEGMEVAAQEMMDEFLAENDLSLQASAANVTFSVHLSRGLPVAQILHFARMEEVGLIVMGSRGRTGLSNLLIGSHAQRIVQLSPVPVMVVKAQRKDEEGIDEGIEEGINDEAE